MNNIWLTWGEVFNSSLQELWWGFIQFAPKLIVAIVLFIIGWVVSSVVAKAFEQFVGMLKVDKLLSSAGADSAFRKAGITLNSGYFIGQVLRWFVLLVFLLPSLSLVGLDSIGFFIKEDVLGFLPRVIVAAFILIVATIVAEAIAKAIMVGSKSIGVTSANMLASIAKYAVWVFAFIIALGQLGVASAYMQILFTGLVAMLAIAGGLAFGLGAKDSAGRFVSKLGSEMSNKDSSHM